MRGSGLGNAVLVLGAYGLIGSRVADALEAAGHDVLSFGRDAGTAARLRPGAAWAISDLRQMTRAADWQDVLSGVSCVINCAGALQEGPADDLEAVHHHAIAALAEACASHGVRIVQISAVGAVPAAETAFMASKARGDAAIRRSGAAHVILRPGLVLSRDAYGGTALLRMVAALPFLQVLALPGARIQTISVEDLSASVLSAVAGHVPEGFVGDLVEVTPHNLAEIAGALRVWLGFRPASLCLDVPEWAGRLIARCGDALSRLGWRPPLRSTSFAVLAGGVRGDPGPWAELGLPQPRPMAESLARIRVGAAERLQARMLLLMPAMIAGLALFWILSGGVALLRLGEAGAVLEAAGWSARPARISVAAWALIDIAIGAGFLLRAWARRAAEASVLVCGIYLVAGSVITPWLWADPLGPLLKIVPALLAGLAARAILEAR